MAGPDPAIRDHRAPGNAKPGAAPCGTGDIADPRVKPEDDEGNERNERNGGEGAQTPKSHGLPFSPRGRRWREAPDEGARCLPKPQRRPSRDNPQLALAGRP